jgi:hypothetical protein
MSDHENCDRSEDGAVRRSGKSSLVFRLFERSAEAANSGDYLTKMSGKIGRFATAAVGQSVLGQPPRLILAIII